MLMTGLCTAACQTQAPREPVTARSKFAASSILPEALPNARNNRHYDGYYRGSLPCAGCDALDTWVHIDLTATSPAEDKPESNTENVLVDPSADSGFVELGGTDPNTAPNDVTNGNVTNGNVTNGNVTNGNVAERNDSGNTLVTAPSMDMMASAELVETVRGSPRAGETRHRALDIEWDGSGSMIRLHGDVDGDGQIENIRYYRVIEGALEAMQLRHGALPGEEASRHLLRRWEHFEGDTMTLFVNPETWQVGDTAGRLPALLNQRGGNDRVSRSLSGELAFDCELQTATMSGARVWDGPFATREVIESIDWELDATEEPELAASLFAWACR